MHYLLLNLRYRRKLQFYLRIKRYINENYRFISENGDISTKTTGLSPKMEVYIDENFRFISKYRDISTKTTGISPKMEIYRRKLQVYLRKWRYTSNFLNKASEVSGLDVWVPFFIHNAIYKL